ncbi:hypothetical protein AAW00_00605 [Aurantiacibacter luteus]|uniref:Lipoprotein n=2 Tax=Aurantiacibacter luteus TaxID=1581420 RepID=A0A0G9MWE9_9SPHN|nr:hypothetical protein AAW00_00605 [Aurantiacibacter luteus]
MQPRLLPVFAASLVLLPLLGACASAGEDDYPSLAIREAERDTGAFQPPPYVPTYPAPAAVAGAQGFAAQAREAHAAFLAALPAARARVNTARGSGMGSDAWSVAQVAVATLEGHRARAMIALVELDRIYVDAGTEGQETAGVQDLRGPVEALVAEENAIVAGLLGDLR